MGMIVDLLSMVFGNGRNVLRDTVEVFHENAEAGAQRDVVVQSNALAQFGAEFARSRQGVFDRLIDGLNRLPRPALALGTLGLFTSAMVDPLWFAARMQGIALVPEPLWWLLGVIVSFYFGARHQSKHQAFQRDLAAQLAMAPAVMGRLAALDRLQAGTADTPGAADPGTDADLALSASGPEGNPALEDWRALRDR